MALRRVANYENNLNNREENLTVRLGAEIGASLELDLMGSGDYRSDLRALPVGNTAVVVSMAGSNGNFLSILQTTQLNSYLGSRETGNCIENMAGNVVSRHVVGMKGWAGFI